MPLPLKLERQNITHGGLMIAPTIERDVSAIVQDAI
jgi:hypothetical protein